MNRLDELKGLSKHLLRLIKLVAIANVAIIFGSIGLYRNNSNFEFIMVGIFLSIILDVIFIFLFSKNMNAINEIGDL
jgi:hypothetical protein